MNTRFFPVPTSIRIGFATYKVDGMSPEEATEADHYGITDNNALTIRLNLDGAPERLVNTLLHELLHTLWDVGDLGETEAEEKTVAVLANQLCGAIRDNPKLFADMLATLSGYVATARGPSMPAQEFERVVLSAEREYLGEK